MVPTAPRLMLSLCILLLASSPPATAQPRIATLDWTLAETLIALDAAPVGIAQIDAYRAWVGAPHPPASSVDLGLRSQPNLELLASLAPDYLVISPMFSNLVPRLERIAPVHLFSLYRADQDTWQQLCDMTRGIAQLAEREAEAEQMIEEAEARLEALAQQRTSDPSPLLVIQFIDDRHVRVFGRGGLYQAVMTRLGLDNAWQGETNAWGFSLVPLEQLIPLDAQLVVIEPYPLGVEAALTRSALWPLLPSVAEDRVINLPAVWSFGALPSAMRFAELLAAHLEGDIDAL